MFDDRREAASGACIGHRVVHERERARRAGARARDCRAARSQARLRAVVAEKLRRRSSRRRRCR
ncbi:hypothetical protein GLE_4428 [Lysobacter enzymogenes]|uniref:Uncharacterized protein n=1 Tax=Lysobacter enzymogenes TaxID=69 RepID=A0A0S2DMY3_LYSEN|nr:hypothetical protein GLE_4428 [Lysobacter enzymogenes]